MPHPNRSKAKNNLASNPTPVEIREVREALELSPAEAGKICFNTGTWWEDCEAGRKRMHPAIWRFFLLVSGDTLAAAIDATRAYIQYCEPRVKAHVPEQLAQIALDRMERIEEILGLPAKSE